MLLPHQGLGDFIGLIGAVRHFASRLDRVTLAVERKRLANVQLLFGDLNNVELFAFEATEAQLRQPLWRLPVISAACAGKDVRASGIHRQPPPTHVHCRHSKSLTDGFYCDLGLEPSVKQTCFKLPATQNATRLLELLEQKPFCFAHQQASTKAIRIQTSDLSMMIIDPCDNHYDATDARYALAEQFIGHPIVDYQLLIQSAEEIRVIDSCFACMAFRLPIVAKKKIYYSRFPQPLGDLDATWQFERAV